MAFGTESVLVLPLAFALVVLASAVEFDDGIAMVAVAAVVGGAAELVVATRSQEGHIVSVVAGSCM